jgi:hypothetical protein
MRQEPAGFHRHDERGRRLLAPAGKRFSFRQAVEGVVDLDGVEDAQVMVQPA